MKTGELCAGYNGLGMSVEEVFGASPAWFSEYDAAPSKILAHHYPDVPNYGDMTKIDWAAIETVDIISGGTPCQDLSGAGRRAGMTEGTRSNLWVQMREATAIQRPKYVVWENVRGAYSAEASSDLEQCTGCVGDTADGRVFLRALGRVLGDLSDLGYDTQWRGLRASDVGAPHARFRVFVLAHDTRGIRGAEAIEHDGRDASAEDRAGFPDESDSHAVRLGSLRETPADRNHLGEHGAGEWTEQDRRGQSADGGLTSADTESIGWREGRPESARFERGPSTPGDSSSTADAASARRAEGQDGRAGSRYEGTGAWGVELERAGGERTGSPASHASRRTIGEHSREPSPEEAGVGDRDGLADHRGERPATDWGPYEPAIRRWESVMGRHSPAPTEPTGRDGGQRLSPRFTEWMMGLPDGWVTDPAIGISRNEQLKACGNGVVPQQAIAALRDMLHAFENQEIAA